MLTPRYLTSRYEDILDSLSIDNSRIISNYTLKSLSYDSRTRRYNLVTEILIVYPKKVKTLKVEIPELSERIRSPQDAVFEVDHSISKIQSIPHEGKSLILVFAQPTSVNYKLSRLWGKWESSNQVYFE